MSPEMYILLFMAFLAGVGADAASTRFTAWWMLTSQRRRDRKLLRRSLRETPPPIQPPQPAHKAVKVVSAPASDAADLARNSFRVDILPGTDNSQIGPLMTRFTCDILVEDRRRWFAYNANGGVN